MDPVSPLFAVVCLVLAIATAYFLFKRYGKPLVHERYASLDGLRGYLAFFVFLHHSSVWYGYLRSDQWKVPPSSLYAHFGQSSVAFFFMITGFLFFSKLIDGRAREIDWGRLFVSRFLRLVPLYLFVMLVMFSLVVVVSRGVLNESLDELAKNGLRWLAFTILGAPDLNGVPHTSSIVAGVTWSLPYEWFFYFSLPLLALSIGVRAPLPYVLLSILATVGLILWGPGINNLLFFAGGMTASVAVRSDSIRRFAESRLASILCLGILVATVATFPSARGVIPLVMLSAVFVLIACGNTLFGVLTHPASRTLGEMAYSIYLLHGILLFAVFRLFIGTAEAASYSPIEHWAVAACITPVLILTSFVTFKLIENPAMQQTRAVSQWVRMRGAALSRRGVLQR